MNEQYNVYCTMRTARRFLGTRSSNASVLVLAQQFEVIFFPFFLIQYDTYSPEFDCWTTILEKNSFAVYFPRLSLVFPCYHSIFLSSSATTKTMSDDLQDDVVDMSKSSSSSSSGHLENTQSNKSWAGDDASSTTAAMVTPAAGKNDAFAPSASNHAAAISDPRA